MHTFAFVPRLALTAIAELTRQINLGRHRLDARNAALDQLVGCMASHLITKAYDAARRGVDTASSIARTAVHSCRTPVLSLLGRVWPSLIVFHPVALRIESGPVRNARDVE